jgi:CubicO group peptidase (beta-lactamase class C family)
MTSLLMMKVTRFVLMSALGSTLCSGEMPGPLATKLQPFVDDGTMAGAVVLVANKDKVLDLEAVGFADLAAKKPAATTDLYWIASQSKAMTASLLMMLVDEGKVHVDDPVEKYLPEFKGQMVVDPKDPTHTPQPARHPITIHEILSHTSGLPFRPLGESGVLDNRPLAQEVAIYAKRPLIFQPGSKYAYSNAGIGTAARIVEVVSGEPYEKFMQERLFDPLGMKDTTFWPTAEQLQRLVKSYDGPPLAHPRKPGEPPLMPVPPSQPTLHEVKYDQLAYPLDDHTKRFPMPAGGLFSTAEDCGKFCRMFLNDGTLDGHTYLSPESVKLMTTEETGPEVKVNYGFGWCIDSGGYSHGGAYKSYMGVDKKRGLVLIFLVQLSQTWGTERGKDVLSTFVKAAQTMVSGSSSAQVLTEGQQSR